MAGESQGVSTFTVAPAAEGRRLDAFLAGEAQGVSRAKIQKLIERGDVSVNGAPARARDQVRAGDSIRVVWGPPPPSRLEPVEMALAILYEDAHIIVINKPAGLTVHPGAGTTGPTLVQGLLYHAGKLGAAAAASQNDPTAWQRPGIVHRLDKDTSGVIVAAKTDKAHWALARQFQDKTTLRRQYLALLDGAMPAPEIWHESYLYRDPAARLRFASLPLVQVKDQAAALVKKGYRYAKSLFQRKRVFAGRLTEAEVRLYTGRTHQIRVHAKDLGLPLVGDQLYHRATQLPHAFPPEVRAAVHAVGRQMLHAEVLGFRHPESGEELVLKAPLPDDFCNLIKLLEPFSQDPFVPIKGLS